MDSRHPFQPLDVDLWNGSPSQENRSIACLPKRSSWIGRTTDSLKQTDTILKSYIDEAGKPFPFSAQLFSSTKRLGLETATAFIFESGRPDNGSPAKWILTINLQYINKRKIRFAARWQKKSRMVRKFSEKPSILSSLWMVVSIAFFPKWFNIALLRFLLVSTILVEYGNHRKWRLFTLTYGSLFNRILREKETQEKFHLSGAPYVIAAALMVTIIFPKTAMIRFVRHAHRRHRCRTCRQKAGQA